MPRDGLSGSESVCRVPNDASLRTVASIRAGETSARIASTCGFLFEPTSTCWAREGRAEKVPRQAKTRAAAKAVLIGEALPGRELLSRRRDQHNRPEPPRASGPGFPGSGPGHSRSTTPEP